MEMMLVGAVSVASVGVGLSVSFLSLKAVLALLRTDRKGSRETPPPGAPRD